MISQTAKYALRTLGFLVDHPGKRITGEEIASSTGIPANYLSKILNQLRKRGLVDSEKGWGGGFRLRPEAGAVTIREILTIFDGVEGGPEQACVFGLPRCDAAAPCPLHAYWERICRTREEMLTETTIQDLGMRRENV